MIKILMLLLLMMIQKAKNQDRIMLARCGAFIIAIEGDAIFLSQIFGFKLTCFKSGVCKIGIPITYILKYLKMIKKLNQ